MYLYESKPRKEDTWEDTHNQLVDNTTEISLEDTHNQLVDNTTEISLEDTHNQLVDNTTEISLEDTQHCTTILIRICFLLSSIPFHI
jgi:hypothetical protein